MKENRDTCSLPFAYQILPKENFPNEPNKANSISQQFQIRKQNSEEFISNECQKIEKSLFHFLEQNKKLNVELKKLEHENEESYSNLEVVLKQNKIEIAQNKILKDDISSLEAVIRKLTERLNEQKDDEAKFDRKLERKSRDVEDEKQKYRNLQNENSEIKLEIKKMEAKTEKEKLEIFDFQNKNKILSEEIESVKSNSKRILEEMSRIDEETWAIQKEIENCKLIELSSKENEMILSNTKIEGLREGEDVDTKIKSTKTEIQEILQKVKFLEKENDRIIEQLAEFENTSNRDNSSVME